MIPAFVLFPMLNIALIHLIRGDYIYKVTFIVCVGEEGNERKKSIPVWFLLLLFIFILPLYFFLR